MALKYVHTISSSSSSWSSIGEAASLDSSALSSVPLTICEVPLVVKILSLIGGFASMGSLATSLKQNFPFYRQDFLHFIYFAIFFSDAPALSLLLQSQLFSCQQISRAFRDNT
jgi:hypothetical protein